VLVDAAREGDLLAELGRCGRVEQDPASEKEKRRSSGELEGQGGRGGRERTHLARSALTDRTRPPSDVEPLRRERAREKKR